ncbi:MAG: RNA polymerase sigma factor [Oscillospiraceae bacterium]
MLKINGDNFPQYYREHIQTVYRIALGIVKIPEEAEDIVTDCFTAMIKKCEFTDEKHLKAWLIITAEHRALNVVKSARMKRTVPLEQLPERGSSHGESGGIREMVLCLPDKLKTATYLYYFEDMPVAEIAATLGISENNVYRRLAQARKRLKLELEEETL